MRSSFLGLFLAVIFALAVGAGCAKARCEDICHCNDFGMGIDDCIDECEDEYGDSDVCADAVTDLASCIDDNGCGECGAAWWEFGSDCYF